MARPKQETTEDVQSPEIIDVSKPKTVEPVRKYKGEGTFIHDVFKAEPAYMKKNTSWTKLKPKIEEIVHSHIFHSTDNEGNKNDATAPVGGHFHPIELTTDDKGLLAAICGPPMRKKSVSLGDGTYETVDAPVTFAIPKGEIVDSHTHDMRYLHSEEISASIIRGRLLDDAEKFKKLHSNVKSPAAKAE